MATIMAAISYSKHGNSQRNEGEDVHDAKGDGFTDDLMGVAKGHALHHQVVGQVGGG